MIDNNRPDKLSGFGFGSMSTIILMSTYFIFHDNITRDNTTFANSISHALGYDALWIMLMIMFFAIGFPSLVHDIKLINNRRKGKIAR